ncbi:SGNH/GDSL hydrolase family protein, partial [Pseudomonas sp. MWU12-2115]|uniref:SGNH/GDSL hydrolase family protein n=1 Tax=Pseudomonas sp. MWU12-2115 TaxID=2071713 RepID=UPI002114B266
MYGASQWRRPVASRSYVGRISNGRGWSENLADQLKLPFYNWAIVGSAADSHLVVPSLLQQVDSWAQYMQKAPGYRPENTLFTMLIGGNDLLNSGRAADQVIADQGKSLDMIIAARGRNNVLTKLPDQPRPPSRAAAGSGAPLAPHAQDDPA